VDSFRRLLFFLRSAGPLYAMQDTILRYRPARLLLARTKSAASSRERMNTFGVPANRSGGLNLNSVMPVLRNLS
jgi:hypothetical protein